MIKYILIGGLLMGAVIAIILGSMYVVHVRSMSSSTSDNLQTSGASVGSTITPTVLPTSLVSTILPTQVITITTSLPTGVLAAPTTSPTVVLAAPSLKMMILLDYQLKS